MREIKFRGKRLDDGEWEYGSLLEQKDIDACGSNYFIVEMTRSTDFDCKWKERVDPKTIGQFTGLTDKNGKEMYEGDILLVNGKQKVVVSFKDGQFVISYYALNLLRDRTLESVVIGNIWDNPEMLKESD